MILFLSSNPKVIRRLAKLIARGVFLPQFMTRVKTAAQAIVSKEQGDQT